MVTSVVGAQRVPTRLRRLQWRHQRLIIIRLRRHRLLLEPMAQALMQHLLQAVLMLRQAVMVPVAMEQAHTERALERLRLIAVQATLRRHHRLPVMARLPMRRLLAMGQGLHTEATRPARIPIPFGRV